MIIATAGHIDHGKTSLVRALTGVDTDRLAEEKRRGMTIDLGFAYHPVPGGGILGFVDVPGHERFVRTMLAGVAGVDFALFVVAADDGVMPQTREHLDILDLLGLSRGAVALTKTDLADAGRIAAVTAELRALLAPTPLADAPVFPVSTVTGEGVDELRTHLEASALRNAGADGRGHFRLAVDRVFTLTGAGLIVTGAAFSGRVSVGDQLVLSPSGVSVRVRGLHAQNRESESAGAGERCAVNVAGPGLEKDAVRRGDWLLAPGAHAPTMRLDARLVVARGEARTLSNWTPVHLHIGADDVPARAAILEGPSIAPGQSGLVRLALDRPVGALAGDRFILRDQSARRTIAGGHVIDPFPPPRGRARPERLAAIRALDTPDAAAALAGLLAVSPAGVDLVQFAQARNLTGEEAEAVFAGVDMTRHGAAAMSPAHAAALRARILECLDEFHAARADRLGPDAATLRRAIGGRVREELVTGALGELVAGGEIGTRGPLVHRTGFRPSLAREHEARWAVIEPVLEAAGLAPPVVHEIAKETGLGANEVAQTLRHAEGLGLVIRIGRNRFAPSETVSRYVDIAAGLAKAGTLTVGDFRSTAGIGRNLSIEVLEHFDRVGMTRRDGNLRHFMRPDRAGARL